MGQKLMGHTLPAETVCKDSVIHMGSDESVLILIKHCRDMKQQETRLRLITLLLLLSCMALFIFITGADFRHHENSGSSGQGSAAEQSPAYSKQEQLCAAAPDNPPANFQKLHIDLSAVKTDAWSDGQYIKWNAVFGENNYNQEKRAIVIPEPGFYFVYVRIILNCNGEIEAKKFKVELRWWNEGYNKTLPLTEAWDGIVCPQEEFRNVFVGQLFDLSKGDHVNVWIEEGYELISRSSFGAYLT